jgi:hypothetical protein
LPFPLLRPLLQSSACEFWNLQGEPASDDWRTCPPQVLARDIPHCRTGILPLAAAISELDLLITVDTLAVHLAGAMGRPAWLLLQRDADWRWMTGRSDSPWYPSLRLFRQSHQGDWTTLIAGVAAELKQWLCTP